MYRTLWTIVAIFCVLCNQVNAHEPRQENEAGFLSDPAHSQFALPLKVVVGLLGFDGNGAQQLSVDPKRLQQALADALPIYVPANSAMQQESNCQYHIDYDTKHFDKNTLQTFEQELKSNFELIGRTADGINIFDVQANHLTSFFDGLYLEGFTLNNGERQTEQQAESSIGEQQQAPPLAVIIVNPDKIRMNPVKNSPYIYRYRYENGAPTQQWIASKRYIVVDLAAGPITYGLSDAGEGTVTLGSIPLVDVNPTPNAVNLATPKFVSELSSFVISGVRHVFVSDMAWRNLKYAEKVIVPIVVFRNHRRFHPLRQEGGEDTLGEHAVGPVNDVKIDLAAIKHEVSKLLLPEQELSVVHGIHHLHDHHHISAAVFKAMRQDSVHSMSPGTGMDTKSRPYLDSKILIQELEHAADELVAGLMIAEDETPPTPLPSGMASSPRPAGHHVLPVFVLSLLGMPAQLLLDQKHLQVATSRCVLVLQTGSAPVPLPYFTDGALVTLNPRSPTRHIVAGLTTALGGVSPPYERYHADKKQVQLNFLWSQGAIPFGPFSNSSRISWFFADSAVRNSVTSRITSSLRAIQRALDRMRQFHADYVDSADEDEEDQANGVATKRVAKTKSPFQGKGKSAVVLGVASEVSQRLASELNGIEEQFLTLHSLLTLNRWSSAHALSGTILVTARGFDKYVESEMISAREAFECCHKVYSRETGINWLSVLTWFTLVCIMAAGIYTALRKRMPHGPATYGRNNDLLRQTIGSYASKQRNW